jgi:PTS system nitrogen regulatory IIA component
VTGQPAPAGLVFGAPGFEPIPPAPPDPMNRIAPLLPAANILVDVDASTKLRLFETVGALVERNRGLSKTLVSDSLAARERLGSTGLGQGIAIPHGRIKGLAEAQGAFVRLKTPIAFDAPDGKPVGQAFVLLVPEQATEQHLELLSELAQMFSEKAFRDRLATAPDADGLHAVFAAWEPAA